MIGLVHLLIVCVQVYATGQDKGTPGRHPERMLARLLPDQHQVRARIEGNISSKVLGVSNVGMPVMLLDRDAYATIQSLGLEGCTFAHVTMWK